MPSQHFEREHSCHCRTYGGGHAYQDGAYSSNYYPYPVGSVPSPSPRGDSTAPYLTSPIPGGHHSPSSDGEEAQHLSHTTRASPATIQWLLHNYETAEGVSLPRCTLYNHYLKHCDDNKLDPVNAASFGKLIRSVFLGLRTRRLGTRGNSKYHYYGIRIKADSALNRITDDNLPMAMRQQPTHPNRRRSGQALPHYDRAAQPQAPYAPPPPAPANPVLAATAPPPIDYTSGLEPFISHIRPDQCTPDLPPPPIVALEAGLEKAALLSGHALAFFGLYTTHCEEILACVKKLHLGQVERLWREFWGEEDLGKDGENCRLAPDQVFAICDLPEVAAWILELDCAYYQLMVQILIPDVLVHIPSQLAQGIRTFAKSLEQGLYLAMGDRIPDSLRQAKGDVVSSLAQTLRRYTSLNHLAQAARAVLQNPSQIATMLTDLNRVDFACIQEQAAWVSRCDRNLVFQLENEFKAKLRQEATLEQWAEWLASVVDSSLSAGHNQPPAAQTAAAKQFLLKWSFYSSMVIRDLTLRSAASFGSFHLIRLLYDEYMFYLVERRLAQASGLTSIAVMSAKEGPNIQASIGGFAQPPPPVPHFAPLLPAHAEPPNSDSDFAHPQAVVVPQATLELSSDEGTPGKRVKNSP